MIMVYFWYRSGFCFIFFSPATKEIHVLFDHPRQMELSPKDVERAMRDTTASPTSNISVTFPIENSTPIPSGVKLWREFISKRHCKIELIKRNFNSCSSKTLKKRQKSHRINNLYATNKKFSRQLPIVPHCWKIIYNLCL